MKCSPMRPLRRYMIEFGSAMASYMGVLIGVVASRPHEGAATYLELLPAIPLFFALWAILRQYKRFDEFYQRVHSEAFALGALILGAGIMVWGFAENAGFPELSTMWIAPALLMLWGLCLPITLRRYK